MDNLPISVWVSQARVLPLLVVCLAVGCGTPTGEVSGAVTYDGEPLPSGTVAFVAEDGRNRDKVKLAGITSDGRYHIQNSLCGDVRISVQTPPAVKGRFAAMSLPSIEIPQKYADADKSGLTYTVKPGPQTFDIKLTGPASVRKVKASANPETSNKELKGKKKLKGDP
jgi:hypothetical protein